VDRIDADGDQADGSIAARLLLRRLLGQLLLEARHAAGEHGADVRAAREDEVGHPDASGEVVGADSRPVALGEREGRDRAQHRQRLVAPAAEHDDDRQGERERATEPC
jgi:hypothetical protein